jgi:hypothetical protein
MCGGTCALMQRLTPGTAPSKDIYEWVDAGSGRCGRAGLFAKACADGGVGFALSESSPLP